MQSLSNANFGPVIAYLVPGATLLIGISPFSATLRSWFATAPAEVPTIGGFLYLTLASLAVGMLIGAVRWAIIDHIHALTGLKPPPRDFAKLGENVEAYTLLIRNHYDYYQFYANMAVAISIAYPAYRIALGGPILWQDLGVPVLVVFLWVASRDALRKFYTWSGQLLAPRRKPVR